jgi:hypothetical protein
MGFLLEQADAAFVGAWPGLRLTALFADSETEII